MKRVLLLSIFTLVVSAFAAKAQTTADNTPVTDRKKIELRPNSREYGAIQRDNFQKRIDRHRDKARLLKKKMHIQKQNLKQKQRIKKSPVRKNQDIIRRRQSVQQRRILRR